MQRPQKRAELRHLTRDFLVQVTYLVVVVGLLIGLLALKERYLPWLDWFAVTIAYAFLGSYAVWAIEGYRTRARERGLIAAARAAANETLHDFTFNDGSKGSFEPAGVLQAGTGLIIAIDAHHALVRFIRTGRYPGLGHDWIYELPPNQDVDVASHPSRRGKGEPVPSLVFSSEEEDGFHVTGFALASESTAPARALVAQLTRLRQRADLN